MVCCVRVPGPGGQRMQEVTHLPHDDPALLELGDWLAELGVTRVVMEATSDYWQPPFYLLEDRFETWLVNAQDVKHLPGRPKTDRLDAVWLCKVAERQMLRPSFVPPPQIRQLRDLTRYRVDLVAVRTAEKQRVEKLLEDALIKLSVVVSDIFGVSGRAMMAALIAGERDPEVLAELARGRMRAKTAALDEALTGRFTDHHAFLLARCCTGSMRSPPTSPPCRPASTTRSATRARGGTPGCDPGDRAGRRADDPGRDRHRHDPLPDPGAPGLLGAVRPRSQRIRRPPEGKAASGKGNRYLARVLGEAAVSAARTDTFLGERYRRIARRRGKKRAIVAVGRSILVIIWALLSDEEAQFIDLGPDYYANRNNPERKARHHIRELQALGYSVTLNPAA